MFFLIYFRVEFYLALHQAAYDVMNELFPATQNEVVYLAALRAQQTMGPFSRMHLGKGRYQVILQASFISRNVL